MSNDPVRSYCFAVARNTEFKLKAIPRGIYSWESSCMKWSSHMTASNWILSSVLLHHHHHHHVVLLAQVSHTLSFHCPLSFIAFGRSSWLHPVSSHSCCMYVLAGRPAFARPYVRVHRSTSLMSSSLLLQQCPTCLVNLIRIVFVMGRGWPYNWCFVGCCRQDLFNIARNILV